MSIPDDGWSITLDVVGVTFPADPDEGLLDLAEALDEHHAAISASTDNTRVSITISIDDDTDNLTGAGRGAIAEAETLVAKALADTGFSGGTVARIDAMTYAEQDRDLATPNFPELVGIAEVAQILGVTRQRASQLQTKTTFPAPVAVLKAGPVWTRPSLNAFAEQWERRPGHPRKEPPAPLDQETVDEMVATVRNQLEADLERQQQQQARMHDSRVTEV